MYVRSCEARRVELGKWSRGDRRHFMCCAVETGFVVVVVGGFFLFNLTLPGRASYQTRISNPSVQDNQNNKQTNKIRRRNRQKDTVHSDVTFPAYGLRVDVIASVRHVVQNCLYSLYYRSSVAKGIDRPAFQRRLARLTSWPHDVVVVTSRRPVCGGRDRFAIR